MVASGALPALRMRFRVVESNILALPTSAARQWPGLLASSATRQRRRKVRDHVSRLRLASAPEVTNLRALGADITVAVASGVLLQQHFRDLPANVSFTSGLVE